jgi:hypothetical protein
LDMHTQDTGLHKMDLLRDNSFTWRNISIAFYGVIWKTVHGLSNWTNYTREYATVISCNMNIDTETCSQK